MSEHTLSREQKVTLNPLEQAQRILESAPQDVEFQQLLLDSGADDANRDDRYALTLAKYGYDKAMRGELDELTSAGLNMLSRTADCLHHSLALKEKLKYHEARHHKRALSEFNDTIRSYVTLRPETSAEELQQAMLETTLAIIGNMSPAMERFTTNDIRQTIRGIQHEMAFEQQLESLGFEFRRGNVDEDLKGVDYVITIPGVGEIAIDVKASLSEVDVKNHGSDGTPYALGHSGDRPKITIFSGVTDRDLQGGFSISDEVAQSRADALLLPALYTASKQVA